MRNPDIQTPQKEASGATLETRQITLEEFIAMELASGFDRVVENMFDEQGFLKCQ